MRDGRVAAPAVELAAGVDADDVAFRSTRLPGMPCTTSSLTEMQVTAGKGTLPGTPLNSGMALLLDEELLDGGVDFAGGDARPHQRRGDLVGLPDQQAGLAHLRDFTR